VVENEGEKIVYVPLSGEEFRRQEGSSAVNMAERSPCWKDSKRAKRKLGLASSQDTFVKTK
jgi:hypothetical protein